MGEFRGELTGFRHYFPVSFVFVKLLIMKKLAVDDTTDGKKAATKPVYLSDQDLLERWPFLPYETADDPAFKKLLYRLRTVKGKRHLKALLIGKSYGYPLDAVEEWERVNIKFANFPAFAFGDDADTSDDTPKAKKHDPAKTKGLRDWLDINKLP